MKTWRGIVASGLLHAAAIGIVSAHGLPKPVAPVEDTPSIAVELVLDIESSPVLPAASTELADPDAANPPDELPPEQSQQNDIQLAPDIVAAPAADHLPVADSALPLTVPVPPTIPQPVVKEPPVMVAERVPAAEPVAQSAPASTTPPLEPSKPRAEVKAAKEAKQPRPAKSKTKTKASLTPVEKAPASKTRVRQQAALAAGKGSTGKSRSTDGKASDASFKSKVLARLRGAKRYPDDARRKGIEGTAILSFTVGTDGRLTSARIVKGSGHAVLDKAALAMARNASPFPAIPAGLGRSQMTFRVPVQFNVE